ncbi:hypothetical protein PFISCL1PPCAC_27958, partial [Pristionchus fissidentatus]
LSSSEELRQDVAEVGNGRGALALGPVRVVEKNKRGQSVDESLLVKICLHGVLVFVIEDTQISHETDDRKSRPVGEDNVFVLATLLIDRSNHNYLIWAGIVLEVDICDIVVDQAVSKRGFISSILVLRSEFVDERETRLRARCRLCGWEKLGCRAEFLVNRGSVDGPEILAVQSVHIHYRLREETGQIVACSRNIANNVLEEAGRSLSNKRCVSWQASASSRQRTD